MDGEGRRVVDEEHAGVEFIHLRLEQSHAIRWAGEFIVADVDHDAGMVAHPFQHVAQAFGGLGVADATVAPHVVLGI